MCQDIDANVTKLSPNREQRTVQSPSDDRHTAHEGSTLRRGWRCHAPADRQRCACRACRLRLRLRHRVDARRATDGVHECGNALTQRAQGAVQVAHAVSVDVGAAEGCVCVSVCDLEGCMAGVLSLSCSSGEGEACGIWLRSGGRERRAGAGPDARLGCVR